MERKMWDFSEGGERNKEKNKSVERMGEEEIERGKKNVKIID